MIFKLVFLCLELKSLLYSIVTCKLRAANEAATRCELQIAKQVKLERNS
jgi:hypothetical protein